MTGRLEATLYCHRIMCHPLNDYLPLGPARVYEVGDDVAAEAGDSSWH